MIYETMSEDETSGIGEVLGRNAKKGQIFCLEGDLGVGKTVFAGGFARGLGIDEPVNSPTFTIMQIYEGGRLPLYHFDAYRIMSPEEFYEIGCDEYFYGEGVCLVEWASKIKELIPKGAFYINIKKDLSKGLCYRKISVEEI